MQVRTAKGNGVGEFCNGHSIPQFQIAQGLIFYKTGHARQCLSPTSCRKQGSKLCQTIVQAEFTTSKAGSTAYESAAKRRKLRCGLCYEPSFSSTTQLADHLVGKRHYNLFPKRDSVAACPYCGLEMAKHAFYSHIKHAQCQRNFDIDIPQAELRTVRQSQLDEDPRYAPIMKEKVDGGVLKIRPLHYQHTFEAALLCTEAFEISVDPPRFDLMLAELRWQALNYRLDPSPIVAQRVNFDRTDFVEPPPVSDVIREAPSAFELSSFWNGQDRALEKEKHRRKLADSWGVWLWLVAEYIPDDGEGLQQGQDSIIVGATALMFHDRLAALEKISLLENPLSANALNEDLFLSRRLPEKLNHKHAVWVWWTAVHVLYRRRGVAGLLLSGCESVGASAGFWTFYLQADLRQKDDRAGIMPWPPKRYEAAVNAYKKAGYQEVRAGDELRREEDSYEGGKNCLLMYKTFEGDFDYPLLQS